MFASGVHSTSAARLMEARENAAKAAVRQERVGFIRNVVRRGAAKDKHLREDAVIGSLLTTRPVRLNPLIRIPTIITHHNWVFARRNGRSLIIALVLSAIVLLASRRLDAQTGKIADEFSRQRRLHQGTAFSTSFGFGSRIGKRRQITPATAPYFTSFAAANVNLTNFYGVSHPSQPNYLDAFSGSNQGVTGDGYCTFPASTDNLAKQLATAGKSWRVYAQNYPGSLL